ncbi:hypothetical protein GS466_04940 [Rhodococcus hoagii]|nr:hypothetical protein [Prescottella equi]
MAGAAARSGRTDVRGPVRGHRRGAGPTRRRPPLAGRFSSGPRVRFGSDSSGTDRFSAAPDPGSRLDTGTRIIDLRGEPDPEAAAHTWMRTDVTAPLDLLRDRLSVSVLLRIADDRWFWYTRAHHIALDGVGAATMLYRVADLYNAAVEGREPPSARAADLDAVNAADTAYLGSAEPRYAVSAALTASRSAARAEGGSRPSTAALYRSATR